MGYRPYLIHKLNMVCFKAINQKKEICCICQDTCKPAIKCRFCVQGIICSECAISSCEHGINKKCPCCRGEIDTIRFKPDIDPTNFNTISTHVLAQ